MREGLNKAFEHGLPGGGLFFGHQKPAGKAFDPAQLASVLHHYDFSDASTLWQDSVGGESAGLGQFIGVAQDRKGSLDCIAVNSGRRAIAGDWGNGRVCGTALGSTLLRSIDSLNLSGGYYIFIAERTDTDKNFGGLLSTKSSPDIVSSAFELYSGSAAQYSLFADRDQPTKGGLLNTTSGIAAPRRTLVEASVQPDNSGQLLRIWSGATVDDTIIPQDDRDIRPTNAAPLQLFQGLGTSLISGAIGEVIICSSTITAEEIALIRDYMDARWGISA